MTPQARACAADAAATLAKETTADKPERPSEKAGNGAALTLAATLDGMSRNAPAGRPTQNVAIGNICLRTIKFSHRQ
jgi:hypothetical protein